MQQRPSCFYYTHRPTLCQDGETGLYQKKYWEGAYETAYKEKNS